MPLIHLTTFIAAPVQRVFDLSRSIRFHELSMAHTNEKAVDGTTTGLIKLGQTVTWQAKHLFKNRQLTVQITQMKPFEFFEDAMVSGDFASMTHQHYFKATQNGTIVIDLFNYQLPYGWLGKMADKLYLNKYLTALLTKRNSVLRQYAEGNLWKKILPNEVLA